ncbi:MAG: hypothetical protein AB7O24_12475 [Kofleriaceae bacterium]
MRLVGILAVCLCIAASGCKNNGEAAPDPAALKAQRDLVARRDALLAQRAKLQGESDQLATEIERVKAGGGDTSDLDKKKAEVDKQIKGQDTELSSTSNQLSDLASKFDAAAGIAQREAHMGSREGTLAQREARIAERERVLASREAALAQREKETCGASAPMIIQQVAPKGGNYSKSDVQPLLNRAKSTMAKKGILTADLPPNAQGLEADAHAAMKANDWSKAFFAASQLAATVDAIKIDRYFIKAKADRLSHQVRSSKLDDATNQQLTGILSDVMQKFGDGNFSAANTQLNRLASQLK